MAWTRKVKDGWKGGYRDATGKRRTAPGTYTHKTRALRAAAKLEHSPATTSLTWGDWYDQWEPTRDVEKSTRLHDTRRATKHITPRWGRAKLADITRTDVKGWAAELRTTLSPSSVNKVVSVFSSSLKDAADAELIPANPAQGVRIREGEASHERYLTRDELDRVCAELSPSWATIAYLLANTGLRWGEAAGLTWKRVDEERNVILVAEVWDEVNGELKPYPKGRRQRSVPAPSWVLERLRVGDPVVKSPTGVRPGSRNFRRALDQACWLSGVEPFRVHDLRHTYASWLLQGGVTLAELRVLMGHESAATTDRYAHLASVPSERVLSLLDR